MTPDLPEPSSIISRCLQRSAYTCLFAEQAAPLVRLDELARNCIKAEDLEEWQVSSMIDEADLVKCGYVSGFPSQLTVAATISEDSYEHIVSSRKIGSEDLCHRHMHLAPAACLNIYPMMGHHRADHDRAVTTLATVYRYEPQGFSGLVRLWEFKVREVIFAGSRSYVASMIDDAIHAGRQLAGCLGVETRIVEASDHFYPTHENRVRQQMQMRLALKRELVTVLDDREVALASFNLHGTHFSAAYGFDHDNSIVTGCVGFGLHRFLAATNGRVP